MGVAVGLQVMHLLLLNGPNLNLLGQREPGIYGTDTLGSIEASLTAEASKQGVQLDCFQSNFEGALIERIHQAMGVSQGILINAAAYTHTSIAILDSLKTFTGLIYEVHISNIYSSRSSSSVTAVMPCHTSVRIILSYLRSPT